MSRGFIIPTQLIALVVVGVLAGGALLTYNYTIKKAARLEKERDAAILQLQSEQQNTAVANKARAEAEQETAAARQKVTELESLFAKHDLDELLQKKPGLVVNRANLGTKRVFNDLEAAAAD